jgi:hypothetical protein
MNWSSTRYQLTLTALWWGWGILLILVLVALSSQSAIFGDQTSAAWQWFFPNITPTMGLVGAAAYTKGKSPSIQPETIKPLFVLALLASLLYLLLLTAALLGVFFTAHPISWLTKTNIWLGTVQTLAASTLGAFFAK